MPSRLNNASNIRTQSMKPDGTKTVPWDNVSKGQTMLRSKFYLLLLLFIVEIDEFVNVLYDAECNHLTRNLRG